MKVLLIVVGSLVALAIVVVVIGALLPSKHRASRSAIFHASPEKLFALITGPQDWRPDVRSYERASKGGGSFRETNQRGQTVTYETVEIDPPYHYVARIADKNLPYGGQWTYQLEPRGSQTALRITEDGEVYNPVFRFVSRFVIGHTRTIDDYLRALAAETGDSITIAD